VQFILGKPGQNTDAFASNLISLLLSHYFTQCIS